MEIWKDVVDFEGLYQISDFGNVRSLERVSITGHKLKSKLLSLRTDKDGYKIVTLFKNGKRYDFKVHRLVALAFIDNPNNYPVVNHKDENPSNNYFENLEWCTVLYNSNYGTRNSRVSKSKTGKKHLYMIGSKNYFFGKHFHGKYHPKSKKVAQYDLNGLLLNYYDSAVDAAKELQCSSSLIQSCCRGIRATAKGFLWKYI